MYELTGLCAEGGGAAYELTGMPTLRLTGLGIG